MEGRLFAATLAAALGTGLMAGLFFAFSAFVMTALGRISPPAGISAMQSVNVTILNPVFFLVFFGTAALSALLAAVAVMDWSRPGAAWLLAGAALYLGGCILVTMIFNVPLNNALAASNAEAPEAAAVWTNYLSVWTAWNHVRTVACLASAACFILAVRA